jgi:single-stranded-DNA-specific exonuclease
MKYIWKMLDEDPHQDDFSVLAADLHVPSVIARVLAHRNINNYEKAKEYFRPHMKQLHDPFLMQDMELAVQRLHKALRDGERILIYGDYDVDGVTGTAVLYRGLAALGGKVTFFIPQRQKDGYGLSENGIRDAEERKIDLIVAVDCGITAVKEAALIRDLGMELIICDHHQPGAEIPAAVAVLDAKRDGCNYPFKELAGCGVAFKLMQGLYNYLHQPNYKLTELLGLVAIGTSADIVPMIDENRVLVKFGLEKINTDPGVGVQALLEIAKMQNREVTPSLIVFFLAPRINAVGRMGDASRAVYLLITRDRNYAKKIARQLESDNQTRRGIDEETFKQAQEILASEAMPKEQNGLVLYNEGWHIGVVGIVASRIAEKYNRPTVLLTLNDGVAKGSARSIPGVNIFAALDQCRDLLLEFGGHKYAAGVTIAEENLPAFQTRFDWEISRQYPHIERPTLEVDAEISFSIIDAGVLRFLKMMKPYGPLNMRPIFVARKVSIRGAIRQVGRNHLKFKVRQDSIGIDAIFFNSIDILPTLEKYRETIDIVFSVEENTWNGRTTIQLRILDFQEAEQIPV